MVVRIPCVCEYKVLLWLKNGTYTLENQSIYFMMKWKGPSQVIWRSIGITVSEAAGRCGTSE